MGEAAFLRRSFSHPSRERKEGDPMRALGESISFGRFLTEPLDWERWSTFSHNRHLEEIEKFSKAGSVAEKKAYFEAHYKRIAAKKAEETTPEEEANAAANASEARTTEEIHNYTCKGMEKSSSHVGVDIQQESQVTNSVDSNSCGLRVESNILDLALVEAAKSVTCESVIEQNSIQVQIFNKIENVRTHNELMFYHDKNMPIKEAANQEKLNSVSQRKLAFSSSRSQAYNKASKPPTSVKVPTPVCQRKEDNANPNNKKSARESVSRIRPTPKSVHMSVDFASCARETSKFSPLLNKIGNSRMFTTLGKMTKDSPSPQQSSAKASMNVETKHSTVASQSENQRTKPLFDQRVIGRTADGKRPSLNVDHMKSPGACQSKSQLTTISCPFSFRSEGRVSKRKEFFQKLEERNNDKEAGKIQLQTKLKEKGENDLKKLRHSIASKPKSTADSYCGTGSSINHTKKVQLTRPQSPKLGRKPTPSMVQDTSSRPPRRPSVRNDGFKHAIDKNNLAPSSPDTSLPKKNTHENASPNIQL
ncbi:protein WVD2-like 7 isoform X1 [Malania oleifera]|uniref:protein WVD2-like 7 isoform X1 n=1 Tax=Malania oleifera TaxID=397392 RepID=UPI0025AE32FF|nr:protein WVD2-like 7 isoform X1 [Malania oleifera]XP_057949449.1 protein WVD2-like 7 isoform X1 [Malania oleifera]